MSAIPISPEHKHQLLNATRHMKEWLSRLEEAILQHNDTQIWDILGLDRLRPPTAVDEFMTALEDVAIAVETARQPKTLNCS